LADGVARFGYIGATAIAISFLFKQFVIDNKYNWDAIISYVSLANWQAAFHDVVTSVILAIIVIVVAVPEGKIYFYLVLIFQDCL
jgi:Ca2+-transporting ATPase